MRGYKLGKEGKTVIFCLSLLQGQAFCFYRVFFILGWRLWMCDFNWKGKKTQCYIKLVIECTCANKKPNSNKWFTKIVDSIIGTICEPLSDSVKTCAHKKCISFAPLTAKYILEHVFLLWNNYPIQIQCIKALTSSVRTSLSNSQQKAPRLAHAKENRVLPHGQTQIRSSRVKLTAETPADLQITNRITIKLFNTRQRCWCFWLKLKVHFLPMHSHTIL